jgi:C1A family cysteine protease
MFVEKLIRFYLIFVRLQFFRFNVYKHFIYLIKFWQGIFDGPNCPVDSKDTNHILLIVGYDSIDGEDYWILKNSWGTGWGMDGYMWLKRNTNKMYGVCAINAWAYYPVKFEGSNPSIDQ